MDDWLITLGIAFILVILATAALGIGWLLTGKNRLKRGCGGMPNDVVKKCEDDENR